MIELGVNILPHLSVQCTLDLFHLPTLMHNSLFINNIYLHYNPRHFSSINMPICPPEDGHIDARNMSGIIM
jgi:hypothetical protein